MKSDKVTIDLAGLDALAVGQLLRQVAATGKLPTTIPAGQRDALRRVGNALVAPWQLPAGKVAS